MKIKPEFKGTSFNDYHSIHGWIRYHFGKANKCTNPNCNGKSKNFQWALKPGKKYEKNIGNFEELCRSCHGKQDYTEETREKLSKANKGRWFYAKKEKLCKHCGEIITRARTGVLYHPECRKIVEKVLKKASRERNKEKLKLAAKAWSKRNRERINAAYRRRYHAKKLLKVQSENISL